MRSDNGPEFVTVAIQRWLAQRQIATLYIDPGCPWQNGKEERFNGTVRDECLNMHVFASAIEASVRPSAFHHHYNEERPHSALGYQIPSEFKRAWGDTASLLQQIGSTKAHVFGYSDGGMVALELALRHPELIRSLAISSAVYNMDGYAPEIKAGLPQLTADDLPAQMREAYEAVAHHPENWPKLVAKAAAHTSNFTCMQPEALRAIMAPALVMVADNDIVRIDHAKELARLLHTKLVVLPDSDHVSYLLEHPDVLLAKLTAFLDNASE